MYTIVYLPTAEAVRNILATTKDKSLRFNTIELANFYIKEHTFLLSKKDKTPFVISYSIFNSYIIKTFYNVPKHLLEIIEIE